MYDIKHHPWYKDVSWKSLYERQIDAPYKPNCKSEADASNFDVYDEEPLKVASIDKFPHDFSEF